MERMRGWRGLGLAGAAVLLTGCATPSGAPFRERHETAREDLHAAADAVHPSETAEDLVSIDGYLKRAFSENPKLRAAFDRWQAAMERIPQARSLEDPTLSSEYFIEQMDARYQANLTQAFPVFGTRRLREGRAEAEAREALHAFEAERLELFGNVIRSVHEYVYLERATAIAEENLRLFEDLEQVVDERYRSGTATLGDLARAQIERERLADRLAALRDQRGAQSAGLAALLNLPADGPLPWPQVSHSGPASIDEAFLAGLLADLNPELKAAESGIDAARKGRELARRSGWPALMLGGGWMAMPGEGGRGDELDASVMAGVSLPIWRGRVRAEVREADALLRAATHERDDMRNRLRAELGMAVFQFRDAGRRVDLFRNSLIPRAEMGLAAERQAYAAGKADFAALIEAHGTVLEFRLMAERAAADREIALGDIGCCVGLYDVQGEIRKGREGL